MARNGVSGRWTAVVLAVAGASLTGGIVSYSIAVAAPSVTPEVRTFVAPEGREVPCELSGPDLDWYRQRGDQMQAGEMLPDTVSFNNTGATLQFASTKPAGVNPCDGGDGGDGGGGGGGPSCLSEFGFDPEDYWVVMDLDNVNVTTADVYAATNGSFTALGSNDIPTATACSVTYEWVIGDGEWVESPIFPVNALFGGYPPSMSGGSASGAFTTELAVSGLSNDGMGSYNLYGMYVCGDYLALQVSDGTNSYYITAPPCSSYRLESELYTNGATLKYDYQDPWGRASDFTTNPATGGNFNQEVIIPIVKPQSTLTITFGSGGYYTVRTGLDSTVNCADSSVNSTTSISNSNLAANATWSDPSPVDERIYCTNEELP